MNIAILVISPFLVCFMANGATASMTPPEENSMLEKRGFVSQEELRDGEEGEWMKRGKVH